MFVDFIFQAYSISASILILLYFFHSKFAAFYLQVARTANRILWMFLFFILVILAISPLLLLVGYVISENFSFSFQPDLELWILLLALIFIFVAIVVGSFKKRPLLTMFICTLVINFTTIPVGRYDMVNSTIYTLIFFALIAGLIIYSKMVKKDIEKEENQMPERI